MTQKNLKHKLGLTLERRNFRIDSTGWSLLGTDAGLLIKINPAGDVVEIVNGSYAGEQHFTWHAAKRETAKAGKRIPTKEEWLAIIRAVNPSIDPEGESRYDVSVRGRLGLKLAGFTYKAAGAFNLGECGHYWSSTSFGRKGGYGANFSATSIGFDHASRIHGLSVRCLDGSRSPNSASSRAERGLTVSRTAVV